MPAKKVNKILSPEKMVKKDPRHIKAALKAKRVIFKKDFSCCNSCGKDEIWSQFHKSTNSNSLGYAFYHNQQTESASKTGDVMLCFGSFHYGSKSLHNTLVDELDALADQMDQIQKEQNEKKLLLETILKNPEGDQKVEKLESEIGMCEQKCKELKVEFDISFDFLKKKLHRTDEALGKEIVDTLTNIGYQCEWDGSIYNKIVIKGLDTRYFKPKQPKSNH